MRNKPKALLVDPDGGLAASGLADRLRRVGMEPVSIRTHQDARALRGACKTDTCIAFVDAEVELASLEFSMIPLASEVAARRIVGVTVGHAPDRRHRDRLHALGFRRTLETDYDVAELRFETNRIVSADLYLDEKRTRPRAPCAAQAKLRSGGETKPARSYTLSIGGAYLSAPAPWPEGREIEIEIALEGVRACLAARVVHTTTDSTRLAPASPIGMGAVFTDVPPNFEALLAEIVQARRAKLAG
jgi:hypothetical protein